MENLNKVAKMKKALNAKTLDNSQLRTVIGAGVFSLGVYLLVLPFIQVGYE